MNEITYNKIEDENNPKIKQLYWNIAFGLQEVDGLKPSKYMLDLSSKHINNQKTYNEVQKEILKFHNENKDSHKEADLVATAIYEILSDKSFRFDILTFKNYHKRLFSNLDTRKYNPGIFKIRF